MNPVAQDAAAFAQEPPEMGRSGERWPVGSLTARRQHLELSIPKLSTTKAIVVDIDLARAEQVMDRVRAIAGRSGLEYANLPHTPFGAGIAIGFGPTDYVILTNIMGNETNILITSGILIDIKRDRLTALEAANGLTRNHTAFPVYLHDAQAGWALLMQLTVPLMVFADSPRFFEMCVRVPPQVVKEYRNTIPERWDLGGRPWEWTVEDHTDLTLRSGL